MMSPAAQAMRFSSSARLTWFLLRAQDIEIVAFERGHEESDGFLGSPSARRLLAAAPVGERRLDESGNDEARPYARRRPVAQVVFERFRERLQSRLGDVVGGVAGAA